MEEYTTRTNIQRIAVVSTECCSCFIDLPPCRLKQCAFCYRGDEPPLGQGRLVVFGPTPGYIPLHILNRRASSDRDNDCHDHCYRGDHAPPM